jgi:hypothetical protein
MVDGGQGTTLRPPAGQYLDIRRKDVNQWQWMVGKNFHSVRHVDAVSPKLRVPTHASVFEGFGAVNCIEADEFVIVGSLAPGGLSNAWGGGVACFTDAELASFPISPAEMRVSYGVVARRIGVSGACDDDLSDFFGLDEWSQPPVPRIIARKLIGAKIRVIANISAKRFSSGPTRCALTEPLAIGRLRPVWVLSLGLRSAALYSATEDLHLPSRRTRFHIDLAS